MVIKKAVKLSYDRLPAQFHIWELIKMVRIMTGREWVTDGTILRKLRELRNNNIINYEYIHKNFKYKKKDLGEYVQASMFEATNNAC